MFNLWRLNKDTPPVTNKSITGKITVKNIRNILGDSSDIIEKKVYVNSQDYSLAIFGIDGLIDTDLVNDSILKPLALNSNIAKTSSPKELFNLICDGIIYHIDQEEVKDLADVIEKILKGFSLLIFESLNKAIAFDAKKLPSRSIIPPENEGSLKGPREAFIENIRTNTALIRKKLKVPEVKFKSITVGIKSATPIEIAYLEGTADKDILEKVIKRISSLEIDNLVSADIFFENIRDDKYSIFPQVLSTERVDKFCANLTDGKIGILIDGFALGYIIPGVFSMFFQAPEDYSDNYFVSSFIRLIRYSCALLTIILPGFYVAITTFHQEMIPTNLLFSIIDSKQGVPFPTTLEILGLLIAFEILLEASLRLPKPIGATISIIGGLVVGEAAVNAKFISPAIVVVIAAAGISGFVMPSQYLSNSFRIIRLFLFFCGAVAGLFGLSVGFILIVYHLCSLEVFGIPYMVPYTANEGRSMLADTIFRLPKKKEKQNVQS